MKTLFLAPMTAALLALPAVAQPADGQRVQTRATAGPAAAGDTRRTVERRAVQRRDTEDGVEVRDRIERRRIERRPEVDPDPTKREIYQAFKRKLHARAKNAIEDGARPALVRQKVQQAKRKAIRRLKSSPG